MNYTTNTFAGRAEQRGIEQGIEKERANSYKDKINTILKMMNDLPDTKISTYFSMPIEEIAKIREEQSIYP